MEQQIQAYQVNLVLPRGNAYLIINISNLRHSLLNQREQERQK